MTYLVAYIDFSKKWIQLQVTGDVTPDKKASLWQYDQTLFVSIFGLLKEKQKVICLE